VRVRILRRRERLARSRPWRFAQRFFLIAGLFALVFAAYSYAARYVYQAHENREFDRALSAQNVAPSRPHGSAEQHPSTASLRSLIGRIAIPRLGISAMVKEGIDDRTLGLAVGHIPSTALPGETGNVGLAAHRDNLFRNLKDVERDDRITLTTLDNTYVYRVISSQIVNPTEVAVLASSAGEKTLTLVTCYPFYFVGHAPKRFVVRALQAVNTPTAPEAPAGPQTGANGVVSQIPAGLQEARTTLPRGGGNETAP
jgi:sortase A